MFPVIFVMRDGMAMSDGRMMVGMIVDVKAGLVEKRKEEKRNKKKRT